MGFLIFSSKKKKSKNHSPPKTNKQTDQKTLVHNAKAWISSCTVNVKLGAWLSWEGACLHPQSHEFYPQQHISLWSQYLGGRWRQEDQKTKVILCYKANSPDVCHQVTLGPLRLMSRYLAPAINLVTGLQRGHEANQQLYMAYTVCVCVSVCVYVWSSGTTCCWHSWGQWGMDTQQLPVCGIYKYLQSNLQAFIYLEASRISKRETLAP